MNKILNVLASTLGSYGEISQDMLEMILSHFTPVTLRKGDFFSRCGDEEKTAALQISGIMRIYVATPGGDERITDFCRQGDLITTWDMGLPSRRWIQSLTETELLTVKGDDFEKLINNDNRWQKLIRQMTESCLALKNRREMELLTLDASEKYELFLKNYPDVCQSVPQYHIASYLGISPVSLSRLRNSRKN